MNKWILALMLTGFFSPAFPSENCIRAENKTYVSSDQILVMPHGIFYLNESGHAQPVKFLSSDENGLFVVDDYKQCFACGAWSEDGSLHKPNCPFYKKN